MILQHNQLSKVLNSTKSHYLNSEKMLNLKGKVYVDHEFKEEKLTCTLMI